MKKMFNIKVLAEIAIFAAIGFVLDLLAGLYSSFLPFYNGGSISFAAVVVVFIGLRRGMVPAMITGLLMGLLDLTDGFYAISDSFWKIMIQMCADYILSYFVVGLACFLRIFIKKTNSKSKRCIFVCLTMFLGGLFKFFMHFISGMLFWPNNPSDPLWPRMVYSITYNGGYMLPSILLSMLVISIIYLTQPQLFLFDELE